MAERSVADYEAALDDITRRGVDDILHTHHPQHAHRTVRRPIAQPRLRTQRPVERTQTSTRAEPTGRAVSGGIVQSIQARPYATLAIAGLIGFACGALRR